MDAETRRDLPADNKPDFNDGATLYDNNASAKLLALIAVVLFFGVLYLARDILLPIALAMLLSFLLAPMTARFQRFGVTRIPAVILVVTLTLIAIFGVGWLVTNQFIELSRKLPDYKGNLVGRVRVLSKAANSPFKKASETVEEISEELTKNSKEAETKEGDALQAAAGVDAAPQAIDPNVVDAGAAPSARVAKTPPASVSKQEDDAIAVKVVAMPPSPLLQIREWLGPLVTPLTNTGLVGVLVIFILVQREDLRNRAIQLVGRAHIRLTTEAINDAAGRLSRYLRMQLLINAMYGSAAALGLYLLDLPNAFLWGVLALLLRFLPYAGPSLAAAMPIALSLAFFNDWLHPLMTCGLFVVLEVVVNNVLEPWLYGASTGVSSLGIIVAAIFWTWLWGPVGLVLAMPLTVCLVVAGKYIPQLRFVTILFCDRATIPLGEHLYQRLLALDEDEVMMLSKEFLRTGTLEELYSTGFIQALYLAERDRHAGLLKSQQESFVVHATRELIEDFETEAIKPRQNQNLNEKSIANSKSGQHSSDSDDDEAHVWCIAVRDEADETAAEMLAQLLRGRGIPAHVKTTSSLASEVAEQVVGQRDIVVLSVMPPLGGRDGRYHCRRLRDEHARIPILVGLWASEGAENIHQRFESAGATQVVTTLEEALTAIVQLRETGRIKKLPEPHAVAG